MTAAERQQRKRDRVKSGLVLVQEWVPTDKVEAVRRAIAEAVGFTELRLQIKMTAK